MDALSSDWEGMYAYVYPPTVLLAQVIAKLKAHQTRLRLIAPVFRDKDWYPELLDLLIDHIRALPYQWDLLKQPGSDIFNQNPANFGTHTWLLSSDPSERKAILKTSPIAPLDQTESNFWRSTIQMANLHCLVSEQED